MSSKRSLERRLVTVEDFEDPRTELEQYRTPADVAAHLVHLADVTGDLAGRTVVDLGTGTGMLALGAALRSPDRVVGLDRDPDALSVARENERSISPPISIDWLLADGVRAPLCPPGGVTVLMNPPFGAQRGNEHADRAFLETASRIADVSYSIHNRGSREFVDAFASDEGGEITRAYEVSLSVPRQFEFHDRDRATITAEAYRIAWDRSSDSDQS